MRALGYVAKDGVCAADTHLELAPKFWAATRVRIDPAELALEIGHLTVPPPLPTEEQPASG